MFRSSLSVNWYFVWMLVELTLVRRESANYIVKSCYINKTSWVLYWVLTHYRYLLTAWCRVLLETLTGLQLVKKFPAFHGTRRFITALTSLCHPSLSWTSPIQSMYPHHTSWRSILILSTHLRLGLPSGLLPSGFPTKTLYTPLSSTIRATCPAHLILLDFITRTILGEEYKSFSSSLCSLPHSPLPCPSWVQIFSSTPCSVPTSYKLELVYVPELNVFLDFSHTVVRVMKYNTEHMKDTFCLRLLT